MTRNLWLPFWINVALLVLAIPSIGFLPTPESKHLAPIKPISGREEEAGPLLADDDTSLDRYSNAFHAQRTPFRKSMHAVQTVFRLAAGRRNFKILLYSFFLTALASSDTKLLVQYISKRYKWTFAEAGYMLSVKAIVNFVLLAVVVPRMVKASMSRKVAHGHEARLNYIGAEISILVSVVGVLCVALAFRFWMLLGGKHILARLDIPRTERYSSYHLRPWLSTTSVHDVTCENAFCSACAVRHAELQYSHVDEDYGLTCRYTIDDRALG